MTVTTDAAQRTLDSRRIMTDAPLASAHGFDISSKQNYYHERLFDEPAPGAAAQSIIGHAHDGTGAGRALMRSTNGSFSLTSTVAGGPPIVLGVSDVNIHSMAEVGTGSWEFVAGPYYVMSVCYVSPGMGIDVAGTGNSFRVDIQAKASDTAQDPEIAIYNITDGVRSAWTNLTTSPAWYSIDVYAAVQGPAALTRVKLDIHVRLDTYSSGSADFTVYAATPYEYKDGP